MSEMIEQRRKRAREIKAYGTVRKAVEAGSLEQFQDNPNVFNKCLNFSLFIRLTRIFSTFFR